MIACPCLIQSASWPISLFWTICKSRSFDSVLCWRKVVKFGASCVQLMVISPVPMQIHESRCRNTGATSMEGVLSVTIPRVEYIGCCCRSLVGGYHSHPVSVLQYRFLSCGEKNHSHPVSTVIQAPKGWHSCLPLPRKHRLRYLCHTASWALDGLGNECQLCAR